MHTDQLTQRQKDQIKKEITTVFDSIMVRLERMDAEGALKYYSPDFVAFGSEGEKYTFQMLKGQYIKGFNESESYKWTTYNMDFLVITKDMVVITLDGKNVTLLKSGDKLIIDPSHYTFAFRKIEDKWKLCYHHFSGTYIK